MANMHFNNPEKATRLDEVRRRAIGVAESGMALASQGFLDDAEKNLRQAFGLLPHEASIAFNLACVLLGLSRFEEALQLADQIIASSQSFLPNLLVLRAKTLFGMGLLPEAITAFEKAISAEPHNGAAELGLAIALGESGQTLATEAAARRAIAKGANSAGARYVLGRALFSSHRLEDAEAEFRQALQLQPDSGTAHASLAELIWMKTGDADRATHELEACLRRNPAQVDLLATKARILETAGRGLEALDALEQGLAGSPNEVTLRVAAAQIAIGNDPARALVHSQHAVESTPGHQGALTIHADALFAVGRVSEAATIVARQLEANPHDNHAIALLVSAWRLLGDERSQQLYDYKNFVRASLIDTLMGGQAFRTI